VVERGKDLIIVERQDLVHDDATVRMVGLVTSRGGGGEEGWLRPTVGSILWGGLTLVASLFRVCGGESDSGRRLGEERQAGLGSTALGK